MDKKEWEKSRANVVLLSDLLTSSVICKKHIWLCLEFFYLRIESIEMKNDKNCDIDQF